MWRMSGLSLTGYSNLYNPLLIYTGHMNNSPAFHFRLQNLLHTFLLLAGMLLLLSLIGWLIAGLIGVLWALSMGAVLMMAVSKLSARLILFLYGAQPVAPDQLGQLKEIINWLADRSQLPQLPKLFYIPSHAMLAFSVGMQKDTTIAISDGLLRVLNTREMAAVLAHEVGHIQSKDLWVMAVADAISRLTSIMALSGYLIMMIYLPLFIFQGVKIPWLLLLLLIIAPNLSALMQLALSRTREFSADMQAIKLTGDPQGLISALSKIEYYQKTWFEQLLQPSVRVPNPSLLRTHPHTKERIRRLQKIARHEQYPFIHETQIHPVHHKLSQRAPRRRISGLWH